MPRRYSDRQRRSAVLLALERLDHYGTPFACAQAMGPELGVSAETLRKWIVQAQVDAGQRPAPPAAELEELPTGELEELQQLKAEVQDLREVNEILAEATDFFADHLNTRSQEL